MRQLLPTFLIIGVAVTLIALLRSTFRYVVATERAAEAERVLPFLIGTIGGYYGLLTGFILSNTWGGVQSVRNSAMIEINALADMDRIALALPAPTGPVLRNDLAAYLRSVIDDDMKAMAKGQISEATTAAYGRLWSTVATARKDAGPWEAAMLARAFDKIGVVGDQRRIRILASTETLPMIVWAILLIRTPENRLPSAAPTTIWAAPISTPGGLPVVSPARWMAALTSIGPSSI